MKGTQARLSMTQRWRYFRNLVDQKEMAEIEAAALKKKAKGRGCCKPAADAAKEAAPVQPGADPAKAAAPAAGPPPAGVGAAAARPATISTASRSSDPGPLSALISPPPAGENEVKEEAAAATGATVASGQPPGAQAVNATGLGARTPVGPINKEVQQAAKRAEEVLPYNQNDHGAVRLLQCLDKTAGCWLDCFNGDEVETDSNDLASIKEVRERTWAGRWGGRGGNNEKTAIIGALVQPKKSGHAGG